jgi:hypothetical protein
MKTSLQEARANLAKLAKTQKKEWAKCCSIPKKGKAAVAANAAYHNAVQSYLDAFWTYKDVRKSTLGF